MNPKYPIYIISKGRWQDSRRLTVISLEEMNVPFRVVIEPQEYNSYASVISPDKLLVLPFSNLGQGSIPARNWVWDHSVKEGHARHWIMDDNIRFFYRYNNNTVIRVDDGTIFTCMEDFCDRYENVAMAGPQYYMFCSRKNSRYPAFATNTRVYSCTLLDNTIDYRWRGRYNEDTDLSLRLLKDNYCTVLFYAFIQDKMTTMLMKGGNTDNVYIDGDNRLKFAESLKEQHPDVVEITKKFGRWHHHVNYKPFRFNKLIKKEGVKIPQGVNNYGMELIEINQKI